VRVSVCVYVCVSEKERYAKQKGGKTVEGYVVRDLVGFQLIML